MVKLVRRGPWRAGRQEPNSIVESSHDAIVGITREGIVTTWNPAATRLYGYAPDEIVGHPVEVLYPPERRGEAQEVLRRILGGEEIGQYLTDRKKKDGTIIEVSLTPSPIVDQAGATVGVATVSRQFTELQDARDRFEVRMDKERVEAEEARERYKESVDQERIDAKDAQDRYKEGVDQERIDAKDAQDRYEEGVDQERTDAKDAQDRYEERVGKERVETREARERYEEGVDQDRIEAREARDRFEERVDKDRVDSKDAQDRFEIRVDRERLQARNAQDRIQLERRGARRDMADLEAQLEQARRLESLGQLAGGVAHDFNNLLAVILNYASFVAEELGDATESDWSQRCETARNDVGQIQQAAERAATLTHQLLAFARQEVIRPRVLNLNDVVAGIEDMLRRTIGENVQLVTSLADGLWPVLADPGRIEQVLVNLAVNARDAMPGGGTVTIDTGNVTVDASSVAGGSPARQGRNVRLRVSDTGTGMPPEVAEHAFEPFFTTKSKGAGTGLGLATVFGILSQADGHIQIYSEHHNGTTISVTLPVTDETPAPVAYPTPYQRTPTGETVLVVEDEEALREVTRRIFTRNGYHVVTAADGPEALDIARHHDGEIHLLVTDVVMPHMLGKEVADRMKAIKPEVEVLYMSGYARPVLASQGRLDAGVALVEKPFSETDLLRTAGQLLNGHFRGFKSVDPTPSDTT
jgi:two-component system cell cycle sensor histidine kinase/response regulator CckA